MSETILSYKGFDKDLKCRDFQYEIGKEYQHDGEVSVCSGGFHACEVPLDVFDYYAPCDSRFCQVEQSGLLSRGCEDSKVASEKIKIGAEVGVPGFVKAQIEWVKNICKDAPEQIAQGYRGHAAAQGECGHAAAQGYRGHAAAQGECGHAAAQGSFGHAAAQGDSGHAAAQGSYGHAAAQGDRGHAAAQGDEGHAAAQGDRGHAAAQGECGHAAAQGCSGHAAAQGDEGHAAAQGYRGHAAAQGDRGHAAAQGDGGHAAAQGDGGHAAVKGRDAIAAAFGVGGAAQAALGSWIVCAEWEYTDVWHIKDVKTARVDGEIIKADTWYMLRDGDFVEVTDIG